MRELNKREKVLTTMVAVVVLISTHLLLTKSNKKHLRQLNSQLNALEQSIQQRQQNSDPQEQVAKAGAKQTLQLLSEFTASERASSLEVKRIDRTSENQYRIHMQSHFGVVMRLISFLERRQGQFVLDQVDFKRHPEKGDENRQIQTSILITYKQG